MLPSESKRLNSNCKSTTEGEFAPPAIANEVIGVVGSVAICNVLSAVSTENLLYFTIVISEATAEILGIKNVLIKSLRSVKSDTSGLKFCSITEFISLNSRVVAFMTSSTFITAPHSTHCSGLSEQFNEPVGSHRTRRDQNPIRFVSVESIRVSSIQAWGISILRGLEETTVMSPGIDGYISSFVVGSIENPLVLSHV